MTVINTYNKFIACADLHITNKRPKNRKGDYYSQIISKFSYILALTIKHSENRLLVVAGDFFDSPNVPYKVSRHIIELLIDANIRILVVPGQHDLRYHVSGLDNTPLGILSTCKLVTVLHPDSKVVINGVSFAGAGWNEEPKDPVDVLLMHRMVTKKGELWSGQTNYSPAHGILRKYPWAKCIISGDNHLPHSLRKEGRLQINCGSMVRSTKSQIDFQPRVYLVDTKDWKSRPLKVLVKPSEEVFDFNKIEQDDIQEDAKKEAEKLIARFIDTLPEQDKEKPKFSTILGTLVKQIKPNKNVKNIINQIMEKIN